MKAFVISLSKISSSLKSANNVLENLVKFGFDATLFEGTYGDEAVKLFKIDNRRIAKYGIKTEKLSRDEFKSRFPNEPLSSKAENIEIRLELVNDPKIGKILRPGVIGCFYSHYRLWQKCIDLNEPIFIFEDDVIFERGYTPVVWEDVLMLCTGKVAYETPRYKDHYFNPSIESKVLPLENTSMPGAVGYGITPQGATKLVEAYKEEFLPADTAMNQFVVKLEFHNRLMGRAAIDSDGKESLTRSKLWGNFNDSTDSTG
jgi:GR25 family glycosyltransferase involved in LPS biosynthesis